jgi:2-succinyl-5-enolpyruvyl-6-hydroxy-3-cyclohexene-1-carboxylate synthase
LLNRTAFVPALLVDEIARCGVQHVCVAPGSRSAPLASALVGHGGLRLWSHVDERAGAYFALGLARASRQPVAVVCTSGTAVANLLPAVVEAFHARLPLLVLTADRPPELRDCGAGQTIDQLGIFGTSVRWFFELGTPPVTAAAMRHVRALACRAVAVARGDLGSPPGPVHVNLAFREPLEPCLVPGDVPPEVAETSVARGREGAPWTRVVPSRPVPDGRSLDEVAALLLRAHRPLVVAGPLDDPDPSTGPAVAGLCAALRAPLLAEAASNLRHPTTARFVVDAHDAVVRVTGTAPPGEPGLRPDAVVRLGASPTSKPLATWLSALDDVPHVLVDSAGAWADPAAVATHLAVGTPSVVCAQLAARIGVLRACARDHGRRPPDDPSWPERWQAAGRRARRAIEEALVHETADGARPADAVAVRVFEAHAVAALARVLPAGAILYVGNSLAVRALDAFWPLDAPAVRVLLNRGANGIDGFASSVLGAAAADPTVPVVGLCGDLSFYHDLNGLLAAHRDGVRATLVVLNNDGGGIFDHLPIARYRAGFETLFATPHGLDFAAAAAMYGCSFERVASVQELAAAVTRALAGPRASVVELRIDRGASLAAWREARTCAVRAARQPDAAPLAASDARDRGAADDAGARP